MDRSRLAELLARERATFAGRHPGSARAYQQAGSLFGGVPMTWMSMAAGGFPLYLDRASGARLIDIDGNEYVDFCLGDTGAMAGHSPAAVLGAIDPPGGRAGRADDDAADRGRGLGGAELARRFGLPRWCSR